MKLYLLSISYLFCFLAGACRSKEGINVTVPKRPTINITIPQIESSWSTMVLTVVNQKNSNVIYDLSLESEKDILAGEYISVPLGKGVFLVELAVFDDDGQLIFESCKDENNELLITDRYYKPLFGERCAVELR